MSKQVINYTQTMHDNFTRLPRPSVVEQQAQARQRRDSRLLLGLMLLGAAVSVWVVWMQLVG